MNTDKGIDKAERKYESKTERAQKKQIHPPLPCARMRYGWVREKREPGRVGMPPAWHCGQSSGS